MDERENGGDRDAEEPRAKPPAEGVRIIGAEEAQAAFESGHAAGRRPEDAPRYGDVPAQPQGPRPPLRFPLSDAGAPKLPPATAPSAPPPPQASGPDMPHWTEPPSGENPRILPDDAAPDDDLGAWSSFATQGPRWRDHPADWEEADFDDASALADDETRVGALDTGRSALFSFDEPEPSQPEPEPMTIRSRTPAAEPPPVSRRVGPGRDVGTAIGTGVAVGIVVLIAFKIGKAVSLALITAVLVAAAAELYAAIQRRGYHPATLLGLLGTAALSGAAYWRGERAFPAVFGLFTVFTLLWYLAGVVHAEPVKNTGATLLVFAYVGFLGGFAGLMLKFPDGIGMLLGAIIATVAYDVGAFVVGSRMGHTPMSPRFSPNKTWEGYLGGVSAAVVACLVIVRAIHPWGGGSALELALLVGLAAAPLGDVCESMLKRDLGLKDMGEFLPGHGGVLDRIDALLFVIPATFYLVKLLKLT